MIRLLNLVIERNQGGKETGSFNILGTAIIDMCVCTHNSNNSQNFITYCRLILQLQIV